MSDLPAPLFPRSSDKIASTDSRAMPPRSRPLRILRLNVDVLRQPAPLADPPPHAGPAAGARGNPLQFIDLRAAQLGRRKGSRRDDGWRSTCPPAPDRAWPVASRTGRDGARRCLQSSSSSPEQARPPPVPRKGMKISCQDTRVGTLAGAGSWPGSRDLRIHHLLE